MLELFLEYRAEGQSILAWLLCLAAIVWGGGPERAIALVWLVLFKGLDSIFRDILGAQFRVDELSAFFAFNDLLALVAFVIVAVNANRLYTLWIAAFQIVAMLAHVAREMVEQVSAMSYVILAFGPGYFQLALLAGGLIMHVKRVRRNGPYRGWRRGVHFAGWQALVSTVGRRA